MSEIKTPSAITHESKQKILLLGMLYALIVVGLTCYIAFADVLYAPYIMNMLAGDDRYPAKLFFLLNLLVTGIIIYPLYWVAKKAVTKKDEDMSVVNFLESIDKKQFSFTYSGVISTITFDDLFIQVRRGFLNKSFSLDKLENFFLYRQKRYSAFYMNFTDENGKTSKIMMHAEAGDKQMEALNSELESRFSEKSLNNLPQREAFKILQQPSPVMMGIVVLAIIILVAGGIVGFLLARN